MHYSTPYKNCVIQCRAISHLQLLYTLPTRKQAFNDASLLRAREVFDDRIEIMKDKERAKKTSESNTNGKMKQVAIRQEVVKS